MIFYGRWSPTGWIFLQPRHGESGGGSDVHSERGHRLALWYRSDRQESGDNGWQQLHHQRSGIEFYGNIKDQVDIYIISGNTNQYNSMVFSFITKEISKIR